jgi:carbon starvation protein
MATLIVTAGWGILVANNSISTIWPMFGIANQLLAVIALCLVTTLLVNSGRGKYVPITLLPMLFVTSTTMTAAVQSIKGWIKQMESETMSGLKGTLNIAFTVFIVTCVASLLLIAFSRWMTVLLGNHKPRKESAI